MKRSAVYLERLPWASKGNDIGRPTHFRTKLPCSQEFKIRSSPRGRYSNMAGQILARSGLLLGKGRVENKEQDMSFAES